RIKTHFTNTLNNEAQLAKIMQQLSIEQVLEFSNTQIYKELNNELIPLQENDEKDDLIDECLENQIPLYTSHNNYVFKILEGTFGYNVFFTNEIKPIKNCKVEELDLRLCINIPYESDTETSILKTSLHYEPTRQIFLTDIQHMYNKYKKLFSLNPYSTIKTKRLEAETCFIIPLYIIVKQRFKNTKVSQHLLFTITGLIAYDFGILKLDDKYLPNDNLSSYNDILRKKVMHIVNNNDNLINID
ncbi:MAG: hypothetical protein JW702_05290, partial [Clostridiales bacterium]|nr:hypothetical protein [Clostridiales bacterium]